MASLPSNEEIMETYGIDVTMFPKSGYQVNEEIGMLIIFDRSRIAFEGAVKPKEVVYGSFSDMYFHYFQKIKEL